MEIKKCKNNYYSIEEIVHDYDELNFDEEGLKFNENLVATWKEIKKIKKGIKNKKTKVKIEDNVFGIGNWDCDFRNFAEGLKGGKEITFKGVFKEDKS